MQMTQTLEKLPPPPSHLHLHIAGFYYIPGFWDGKLKREIAAYKRQEEGNVPWKAHSISLVTQHDTARKWDGGLCDLYPLLDFVLMNDLETTRSI